LTIVGRCLHISPNVLGGGFPDTGNLIYRNQLQREENMKIRPLHDRVIVERLESETTTAGGLIIPDTAKEKPIQGKIVAVGAGKRDKNGKVHALDLSEGDRVLFSKYSGTEVKIDGEERLIMREDDILAVVE
jgi:chaperonin GroES